LIAVLVPQACGLRGEAKKAARVSSKAAGRLAILRGASLGPARNQVAKGRLSVDKYRFSQSVSFLQQFVHCKKIDY
jgi:hypothetical protein